MANTLTKGLMQRADMSLWDGVSSAALRSDGSGGTTTGVKVGDAVDVLSVYGSGTERTSAALQAAIDAVGSRNVALSFAPGTWAITTNVTIPANITCQVPAGAVFDVSSGITLTIAGVLFRQHATYTSGLGTVTVTGTDLLAANTADNYALGFAADTGIADAYAIAPSPAISAYAAGQTLRFKVANTNTGAATLNVNGVGAKAIKQADGSTALESGDLIAGQIVQVTYEATDGEFHLVPTTQPEAAQIAATLDISGLTEETSVQAAVDFLMMYDDTAGANRKVKPENVIASSTVLQVVESTYALNTAITSAILHDGSIPQNTEGLEIITQAITPASATSTIVIDAQVLGAKDGTPAITAALFVDATVNALSATYTNFVGASQSVTLPLMYTEASGSTSARTYKLRVGVVSGTFYTNGFSGAFAVGSAGKCRLRITEIE